jgi:alpha-L-fucosidase
MGRWMKVNSDSIYETTASPFARLPFFGRATAKGNKLYLHVFQWPASGRLRVPNLKNLVHSARLLADPATRLATRRDGDDILVSLPAEAPDETASVVELTLDGAPVAGPYVIQPEEAGVLTLGAEACEIETRFEQRAKLENILGHVFLTRWLRSDDVPTWTVRIPKAGRYTVELVYGATRRGEGTEFTLTAGTSRLAGKVAAGRNGWVFQKHAAGAIQLAAGEQTLQIKAKVQGGGEAMNLEKVVLVPVR